jgi:hypothetical protein
MQWEFGGDKVSMQATFTPPWTRLDREGLRILRGLTSSSDTADAGAHDQSNQQYSCQHRAADPTTFSANAGGPANPKDNAAAGHG